MGLVFETLDAVTQAIKDFYGVDNVERINPYELREAMEVPYAVITVGSASLTDGVISSTDENVSVEVVILFKNEQEALNCFDTLKEFSWEIEDDNFNVATILADRFENLSEKKIYNYGVSISITTTK